MGEIKGRVSIYQTTNKKIGRGAFSKVYKGLDLNNDKIVAVKCIEKDGIKERLQARLKSEIKLHSDLDHENIIKLFDFVEDQEFYYLILEYCDCGDLRNYIKKKKRLIETEARDLTVQLATGLKYLRDKNIVHRDLKPHNLLLYNDYTVLKITDFNFARELWDQQMAETLCGSPLYMAPEIIEMNRYSTSSDLWSVGMIVYEMLHGFTPFEDAINPMDLLRKIKKRRIDYNKYLTFNCIELLKGLLTIEPEFRLDWKRFFYHDWLENEIEKFDTDSEEDLFEVQRPRLEINVIEDYAPVPHSQPINISRKEEKSQKRIHSLPVDSNFKNNILDYMSSSVGSVMRGTLNYLSQ